MADGLARLDLYSSAGIL